MQERESYHVSSRNKAETDKTRDFIHSCETNRHINSKKVEKRGGGIKQTSRKCKETRTGRIFNLPIKLSEYQCEDRKQYLYLRRGKINKYQK